MSPRGLVRVADVDAYGTTLNSYSRIHPVSGLEPPAPWAVHLTDRERRFRLIAADFDAHPSAEHARADAEAFAGVLTGLGVAHLVCQSGPSGGRHVWIGLAEPVDAADVVPLVHALKKSYPSFDVSPLANPSTGAVRPPGSPHRSGGTSTVVSGDLGVLIRPTATRADLSSVTAALVGGRRASRPAAVPGGRKVTGDAGQLRLVGARRGLSPTIRGKLAAAPSDGLASHTTMSILCAAARACWSLAEVTGELLDAPGLEYLRTVRAPHGRGRSPRPLTGERSTTATLARMWRTAVSVASSTSRIGYDPTFEARADQVTSLVAGVQARADGCPARWAGARLNARLVLDALSQLALDAVQATVEASNRTLALMTGLDRETTRGALAVLRGEGWISLAHEAEGVHAHRYTLVTAPDVDIHTAAAGLLSQAGAPPARAHLQAVLRQRLAHQRADVFAPAGLGRLAGRLYSLVPETDGTLALSLRTGLAPAEVVHQLARMLACGLIVAEQGEYRHTGDDQLVAAAQQVGTQGVHARRAELYRLERDLWAWWRAELAWMSAPRRARSRQRAAPTQLAMIGDSHVGVWGAHPRRGGRADYTAARRILDSARAVATLAA